MQFCRRRRAGALLAIGHSLTRKSEQEQEFSLKTQKMPASAQQLKTNTLILWSCTVSWSQGLCWRRTGEYNAILMLCTLESPLASMNIWVTLVCTCIDDDRNCNPVTTVHAAGAAARCSTWHAVALSPLCACCSSCALTSTRRQGTCMP
jgi:hypothetical protein